MARLGLGLSRQISLRNNVKAPQYKDVFDASEKVLRSKKVLLSNNISLKSSLFAI